MAPIDSNLSGRQRPGTYLWEPPGKNASISITLDVVDRLLQDVMRGFGAVPKRGAEVGGILLGRTAAATPLSAEVEDYELVPIEYKRGPSYLLSDGDVKAFEETFNRLRHGFKHGLYPVGMFRSHTREAAGLGIEDHKLADRFFSESDKVILLIRPFATKVSVAGFYFREDGRYQNGLPLNEFPFRRKELAGAVGEAAPPPHTEQQPRERGERPRREAPAVPPTMVPAAARPVYATQELTPVRYDDEPEIPLVARGKTWMWLPLSFIFLLLGVLLGFQAALTLHPQASGADDPYHLSLLVTRDGDDLSVRWDRQAPAIRASRHGRLTIQDGQYSKAVDLDPSQLQTGSVVYRHSTKDVKFQLEIQLRDRTALSEAFEWTP